MLTEKIEIQHNPGITKETLIEVFRQHFTGKYEVCSSKVIDRDFVVKKSGVSGVFVKLKQKNGQTQIIFNRNAPSWIMRILLQPLPMFFMGHDVMQDVKKLLLTMQNMNITSSDSIVSMQQDISYSPTRTETKQENESIKRPFSITLIAWYNIIFGVISVFTALAAINSPMTRVQMSNGIVSAEFSIFFGFLGVVITSVSAIAILKAFNWGRILFVIWGIIHLFFNSFATFGLAGTNRIPAQQFMYIALISLAPWTIIFLIELVFLFKPKANAFFMSAMIAKPNTITI